MKTLTNKELLDFVQAGRSYEARRDNDLIKVKGEGRVLTKFDYALGKVLKKAVRKVELFNENQEALNIKFCDEDEKGTILRDERGMLKFKKDAFIERNKAMQKLGDENVEIEEHLVSTIPSTLTIGEMLAFDGLIISAEPEDEKKESS